ncbi:MAG TPA: accessory factor UbiK family protein [Coxiellaceae bacterium]|nr:accessory factor UbiK family protein [Coxiellaceae bacterium]
MINSHSINELVKKLIDSLPPALAQCPSELDKNFHQLIENAFNKLNLVTREEFDAQAAVLLRTREKLERLEKKLLE